MITLPFEKAEYARRLSAIRVEMRRRDIELLAINDVANQHYVTGYDGWSFYTPQIVLVPVEDNEEPVWIGRAMDAAGGLLTAGMAPQNVVGFPMTGIVLLVATVATLSMMNFNTPAGLSRHSMQEANAAQAL